MNISNPLGSAVEALGQAAAGLNGDPNGESQDEYTDFLAIQAFETGIQKLVSKYQAVGR
jgi:hypothetical protein